MEAAVKLSLPPPGVQYGMVTAEEAPTSPPASWSLDAFRGRLAEISGGPAGATLTLAFQIVHEAQRRREHVAWVTARESSFFPPDAAASGVDLDALVVVRLAKLDLAARAADLLVRSGGFGLVVLDLGPRPHVPITVQTRLAGLVKKHHAALVFLTEKTSDLPSLGALVSLRIEAARAEKTGDRFGCEAKVLKDKRRGTGWRHREACRAPDGLC